MKTQWKIGDNMECINSKNTRAPIVEGLKYIINDIRICPTCGMMEFKLSIPYDGEVGYCRACRTEFEKELLDCWWAEHWRFRKISTTNQENVNSNFKITTKEIAKEIDIISN